MTIFNRNLIDYNQFEILTTILDKYYIIENVVVVNALFLIDYNYCKCYLNLVFLMIFINFIDV